MNRRDPSRSFQSYKADTDDRAIDGLTQKLVLNEDLLADIIYRIAMVPISDKDTNVSLRDTGLDISSEDQIINLMRLDVADQTKISYATNDVQNMSGETSMDWFNPHIPKPTKNRSKEVIVRKESEDSFIKMCNPKSNLPNSVRIYLGILFGIINLKIV